MTSPTTRHRGTPFTAPPPGQVRKAGHWVVGSRPDGAAFAVRGRCRHQLADLSNGHVDADGCLVCPWHASRFDTGTGRMVEGPKGLLGYHGRIPGYGALILAFARHLPLRVGRVTRGARSLLVS